MIGFSQNWTSCTQTSSSSKLMYTLRTTPARGQERIESRDSSGPCGIFYRLQTAPKESGVEGEKLLLLPERSSSVGCSVVRWRADGTSCCGAVEECRRDPAAHRGPVRFGFVKAAAEYIATVPDNSELPSHSSTYEYPGKLYEHRQQPDLAVEQYKAALALDPQNKVSHDALKRLQKNKLDPPR